MNQAGHSDRTVANFVAIGGGHAVELFDWTVYGLLAAYFAPRFFPSASVVASTLSALTIFGAAFLARPVGALLLGPLADRTGRKPLMLGSIAVMALCCFGIGVLPAYNVLSWYAALALGTLRMCQGLSSGIEQPLLASYVVELSPEGKSGRIAGLMQTASTSGVLLASLTAYLTTFFVAKPQMSQWGWRIPFLVGGVIGLCVFWLRRSLPETLSTANDRAPYQHGNLWKEVRRHWLAVLAVMFIIGGTQVVTYGWLFGIPSAAKAVYNQDPKLIFGMTTSLTVIILLLCPVIGRIADKIGLGRAFLWTRLLSIPLAFAMLAYNKASSAQFIFVMLVGGVFASMGLAFVNALVASILPSSVRVTGVGLGLNTGIALFGGTSPYIFVWIMSRHVLWLFPAYIGALSLLAILFYRLALRSTGSYSRDLQDPDAAQADTLLNGQLVHAENSAGTSPLVRASGDLNG